MLLTIQLKYGAKTLPLEIEDDAHLSDLMERAEDLTGVPVRGQKLILQGKTLTSLDHTKSLRECKVVNFSKIMVLGKRHDPQSDEMYKRVQELEAKSFEVDKRLAEVAKEARDIGDGYLAKEHHADALRNLLKRCKHGTEEYMRLLETLDGLRFEEHQADAKSKRKSVASKINASLDSNDRLLKEIESLSEDSFH